MKFLNSLKEEVTKAPIGTIGAICGVITLVMDIAIAAGPETHRNLSSKDEFAIAILNSMVICFIFSFVPAKFLDSKLISTKLLYIVFAVVAALFTNGQFLIHFAEKQTSGGLGSLIMMLVGLVLAGLYNVIYIETLNRDEEHTSLTGLEIVAITIVISIQGIIMSSKIYLPIPD